MKKQNLIKQIARNKEVRKEIAYRSHLHFFHMYLSQHVKYVTAGFQREMFSISEDTAIERAVIVAFRGSAKSTIMSLSYPIWAILGKMQNKFVVIISMTQDQARLILANIKEELLNNKLLSRDFGPFSANDFEWSADSIVIPKYGTRITALSANQSIRGIKHKEHRPDLIICDDIEDLPSVKTKESRDKTYNWLNSEVLPLGDKNTKIIVIGNMLHEDSLIMKLKKKALRNKGSWVVRSYPLIDESGNIAWPGKYKDEKSINKLRTSLDRVSWLREYLLKIVPADDVVVRPEWIRYYDKLPVEDDETLFMYEAISVDLAISEKTTADYTAAVRARIYRVHNEIRVYILPHPFNQKVDFPKVINLLESYHREGLHSNITRRIYVEDAGYQRSVVQQLKNMGIHATAVPVHGRDKKTRLSLTTPWLKSGKILFPKESADTLIGQLVGFGVEKHDDLVDAFTMLILKTMEDDPKPIPKYEAISNLFGSVDDEYHRLDLPEGYRYL